MKGPPQFALEDRPGEMDGRYWSMRVSLPPPAQKTSSFVRMPALRRQAKTGPRQWLERGQLSSTDNSVDSLAYFS